MSSHSVTAALGNTTHDAILISGSKLADSYDVIIRFYSAKNLPKTDIFGHTDPYFIAKIDDRISYTSTILCNTSTPQWDDEEWIVRNIPRDAKLVVKLFDKDDGKLLDDYIGRFIIHNLINYNPPLKGNKIIGTFGQYNGRFHLSIRTMQSTEETKKLPRYTFDGPCRYFRHDSLAVGHLTMLNTDCIYSTWKIEMKRISVLFPFYERQHWNRQYQAARTIFDGSPLSLASKSTIKFAHKALHGRTLKNDENGQVNNANDLWRFIFTDKITQKIKPRLYTYVIDNNTWRFSETGNQFFTDFVSKHALLSKCSESVRYAGEFHPRPKYGWNRCDDEWELVFDNGSGTYAPRADLLENLKDLLLYNFPGLNVVTYDYNDPRLKESVEQLKSEMEKHKHITATLHQLVSQHPLTLIEHDDDDDNVWF